MAQLIQDLFAIFQLDMTAPANLAEFFPWLFTVLLACAIIGTFMKWLYGLVTGAGRMLK